jgi:chloride channel 3/4/5
LVIELNDLPYLDAKTHYVHEAVPMDIIDENAPVISLDEENTLESLRQKLAKLYAEGAGGGFPLVGADGDGLRMYGYIASKELEHGLLSANTLAPNAPCTFRAAENVRSGVSMASSFIGASGGHDLSWLIELAPVTVNMRSPMELLHEVRIWFLT